MRFTALAGLLPLAACHKGAGPAGPVYQAVAAERRDIVVSARANGTIQPDTLVEVKSQASGEVLQIRVETGQVVKQGELMVRIDPRIPTNNLEQAKANLEVAQARLENAKSQQDRADELYRTQSITQTELESAHLDYATAKAGVVNAQVAVQNAQITVDQTDVRAPISGTVIEMDVERGQVISSPTSNVGEGTVLMKMADLNQVQVSTLVDETDIGKIEPGLLATVQVDAYPNRPFDGTVLKIEPLATVQQNVTMFPVRVSIRNREGLLKPGMNSEVEIHVGRRDSVLAIPNGALRTQRDVGSAGQVLGLTEAQLQDQLAQATRSRDTGIKVSQVADQPAANTLTLPNGREVPLPRGVSAERVQAAMRKRFSGQEVTAEERALLQQVFRGMGGGGGRPGGEGSGNRRSTDTRFGGDYIVFVVRGGQPVATRIRTGLTDLDYSEVTSGLTERDSVLILPSASLIQSQQEFKQRVRRMTGGGIPGMQSQSQPSSGARPQASSPARN
jgi:HlyD family secretion protein